MTTRSAFISLRVTCFVPRGSRSVRSWPTYAEGQSRGTFNSFEFVLGRQEQTGGIIVCFFFFSFIFRVFSWQTTVGCRLLFLYARTCVLQRYPRSRLLLAREPRFVSGGNSKRGERSQFNGGRLPRWLGECVHARVV